ncbi:MAG: sigma 54-interacting transcriptional regulator [Vicinamibacterales bacterium]
MSAFDLDREWRMLGTTHPNILVVGADAATDAALRALERICRQPVVTRRAADPLDLPSPSSSGTLILRDVDALSLDNQGRLLTWLDEAQGRMQVITTTARELSPLLETRAFLAALYYRLNIVYLNLPEEADRGTRIYPKTRAAQVAPEARRRGTAA